MKKEVLRVEHLTIRLNKGQLFGPLNLSAYQGELLAICGFHHTGKSLLADILAGELCCLEGHVYIYNKLVNTAKGKPIQGIHRIRKTSILIDSLSIADNLFALKKQKPTDIIYNARNAQIRTEKLLKKLDFDLPPNFPVYNLTDSQKHILQIAKFVDMGVKIFVLDDITDNYNSDDFNRLNILFKKYSNTTFIYITNREDQIVKLADRIVILRNLKIAGLIYHDDYSSEKLLAMLHGNVNIKNKVHRNSSIRDEIVIRLYLSDFIEKGNIFSIKSGEIMGILDLHGSYWQNIRFIFTQRERTTCLEIGGKFYSSYIQAVEHGLVFISNQPEENIFPSFTFFENLTFHILKKTSKFSVINKRVIGYVFKKYASQIITNCSERIDTSYYLKLFLYKWIASNPKLIVLENLTLGLNGPLTDQIFTIIDEAARAGIGFLLISTNPAECYDFCDKVLVLKDSMTRYWVYKTKKGYMQKKKIDNPS
jgi:ABC-type sugar transport system ATPase subunit